MIATNNPRFATLYQCLSRSSSNQLFRYHKQKPEVCQIAKREFHFSDFLRTVYNNCALINLPYKPFTIIHNKVREDFCIHLMSSRNMASSSSSNSQKDDHDTSQKSDNKPKFRETREELKARLSPIQYQVTQLKATERPGSGEYNRFNKKGTYHCVVCDEELFKSDTKFESGCGWPAFFDTIEKGKLKFVTDYELVGSTNLLLLAKRADLVRTEVLCNNCNAHLGHRFDDGPVSKGGKRYCINSASLKFSPNPEDK